MADTQQQDDEFERAFAQREGSTDVAVAMPVREAQLQVQDLPTLQEAQAQQGSEQAAGYGLSPLERERLEVAALFDVDDAAPQKQEPVDEFTASNPVKVDAGAAGAAADQQYAQEVFASDAAAAVDFDKGSFGAAFKHFRQQGAKEFTWRGKRFTTNLAPAAPKRQASKKDEAVTQAPAATTQAPAPANPAPVQKPESPRTQQAREAIAAAQPAPNSPSNIWPYNRNTDDGGKRFVPVQRNYTPPAAPEKPRSKLGEVPAVQVRRDASSAGKTAPVRFAAKTKE